VDAQDGQLLMRKARKPEPAAVSAS